LNWRGSAKAEPNSIGKKQLLYFHRKKPREKAEPFAILEQKKMTGRIFDENRKELIASEKSLLEDETLLSLTAGPFTINRHIPIFCKQLLERGPGEICPIPI